MAQNTTSVPTTNPSPFAHLAGKGQSATNAVVDDPAAVAAAAAKKAEEEEKAKKAKEEEKAKKAKEEEEAKKAEEAKKEDDEDEDDDGDDDGDREDEANAEARRIRAHERGRIRTIVNSEAGLANPRAAYELACNDSMSRNRAIATLRAIGPATDAESPRADALRDRMAHTVQPDIGVSATQSTATLAQQIVLAGKKRRGEA